MALKFSALTTVFEKAQIDEYNILKQKHEETTLALERARMEREDFRMGNGPSFCLDFTISSRQMTHSLMQFAQSRVDVIAAARDLIDLGQNATAYGILNAALAEH